MKKIFYILASAIVALGAVACENDGLDNIGLEVNGDTVSFIASIDNTRTDLDGLATVWDSEDTIKVEWNDVTYDFTNSAENPNKFSCSAEGLSGIVNANIVATYSNNGDGEIDSAAGTAGALLTYSGSFAELANGTKGFAVQNAFLKFTTTEKVTLKGEGMFSTGDEITITGNGTEQYVAVNPTATAVAFSYSVDGVQCKSLSKNFEARKVYYLGELKAPAAIWLLGDWDSWAAPLYMFEENGYYVAKNVEIAASQGFKFKTDSMYLGGPSTKGAWNNFNGSNITLGAGTYDIYISKDNGAWCAVTAGSSAPSISGTKYLYFKPSSNWQEGSAKFHAWCWGGSSADAWVAFEWLMYENSANYYFANVKDYKSCKFIRQDPNKAADWSNWGATGDLTINGTLFTIVGWNSSRSWSSLIP